MHCWTTVWQTRYRSQRAFTLRKLRKDGVSNTADALAHLWGPSEYKPEAQAKERLAYRIVGAAPSLALQACIDG
jgi:hypothetical protein